MKTMKKGGNDGYVSPTFHVYELRHKAVIAASNQVYNESVSIPETDEAL